MRILAAGCTGTIGQPLIQALKEKASHITVVGRDRAKIQAMFADDVNAINWEDLNKIKPDDFDVVINLSGAGIADKRWSAAYKKLLIDSRIETTKLLITWMNRSTHPIRLLNASAAASAYPGVEGIAHEESVISNEKMNFSQNLVKQWEACLQAAHDNITCVILRFAVILDKHNGALAEIIKSSKFKTYGILGSGKQPFCWIDIRDAVAAILFLIENQNLSGAFNLCSPHHVSQAEFAKTYAELDNKWIPVKLPAFMVKLMFGEMAEELLLDGIQVQPKRLQAAGFCFQHEKLWDALHGLLNE